MHLDGVAGKPRATLIVYRADHSVEKALWVANKVILRCLQEPTGGKIGLECSPLSVFFD